MSLATDVRDIARERPYLLAALCASVVSYTAAAIELDPGDDEAVAIVLRRFAADLPPLGADPRSVTVTMRNGVGLVDGDVEVTDSEPVLSVAGVDLVDGDPFTVIIAEGEIGPIVLATTLSQLGVRSVVVDAAGVADDILTVVVPRRQGVAALRVVEVTASGLYV